MKKRLGFLLTTGLLVPAISCSNQSINAQKVMHTHNRLSETNKNQNKAKSASENDDKNNSKSVIQKLQKMLISNQINIIFIRSLLVKFKIFFRHLKKQVIK